MPKYRNDLNKKLTESHDQEDISDMINDVESRVNDVISDLENILWEDVLDYEDEFYLAVAKLKDLSSDLY